MVPHFLSTPSSRICSSNTITKNLPSQNVLKNTKWRPKGYNASEGGSDLPIDKKLYFMDGTTRTVSKVRVLDKIIDPSPIMGVVLSFAVEKTYWGEGKKDCN